jgi:hypothetical protein
MRRLLASAATCSLLGGLLTGLLGCGTSTDHVSVRVGRSRLDVHRLASGVTSLQLEVGPHDCRATTVNLAWNELAAQLRAC